jgi:hypothetical protein
MSSPSLHRLLSEALLLIRSFADLEEHNVSLLATMSGLCERLEHLLVDESEVIRVPTLDQLCDLKPRLLLKHAEQTNLIRRLLDTNM